MSPASLDRQEAEQFCRRFEALVTKYAVIWQRDPDGRWRIAVDSSSPNPREG